MKKAFLLLAAGSLLFAACSKNDDSTPSRESLIQGKWTIDSARGVASVLGQTLYEQDFLQGATTCQKDNLLDFVSDHTLYNDEGAAKCNASDPQRSQVGSWQLTNSEKDLMLTNSSYSAFPTGSNTLTIDELTSSHMRLHKDSTATFNGAQINFTFKMHLHK